MTNEIYYSDKYYDDFYEYRHVMLPREISKLVPKSHLMSEAEWRSLGVQQSQGWIHYMKHEPGVFRNIANWLIWGYIASFTNFFCSSDKCKQVIRRFDVLYRVSS
uniref:Cyclin-dependent kinases regulatory subunit n=1 Tax=Phallusia mammillata TaxID=59560 RepID=A0A6F9D8W4_9ASCI|nr:cyclin-dependent kinases regulatory subunit-like [Phallusia mammillata]